MSFFPFFIEISGKKCLIIGGGRTASRKLKRLLPYGCQITVVAPRIAEEITAIPDITVINRKFEERDLNGAFMVICATNDSDLNKRIYTLCKERDIPVNSVDDIENCSFIFPALANGSGVTAAISTAGEAPLYARYLREKIERELQDDAALIESLKAARREGKEKLHTESERKAALEKVLQDYIEGK